MYTIIGADSKEYGPVEADEIRAWIAEGRADGRTLVREGDSAWRPLSAVPEFAAALASAPRAGPAPVLHTHGLAVAGLVMGLISVTFGLFCCVPFLPALGILFSAVAVAQIKRHPDLYTGQGMALAGLVFSAMGMMISIFILTMFGFFRALGAALGVR